MGRRKLEIKRIEDKSARQVTFSKRRKGLLKKAKEISVLCDLDIGLLIYSSRGKPYHYSNTTNNLTEILERYHSSVTDNSSPSSTGGDCNTQECDSKFSEFRTCGKLLQVVEREVEEDELSVNDFVHLQEQLEDALIQTRTAKNPVLLWWNERGRIEPLRIVAECKSLNLVTRSLLESVSALRHKEKLLEEEQRLLKAKIGGSTSNKVAFDLNVVPDDDN